MPKRALCLIVLLACALPSSSGARNAKVTLERDQPTIHRLFRWGNEVVIATDRFLRVDVAAGRVRELTLPERLKPLSFASGGDGPLLLGRGRDGLELWQKRRRWKRIGLPADLVANAEKWPTLAASGSDVAILAGSKAWWRRSGLWKEVTVSPRPVTSGSRGAATHAALHGSALILGYDRGEWGGALPELDLERGVWLTPGRKAGKSAEHEIPVKGFRERAGELWVVRGLAHLSLRAGQILRRVGDRWEVVAASDSLDEYDSKNWGREPANFSAIDWDSRGRLYVLTGTDGLLRRTKKGWESVTPGWPGFTYTSGFVLVDDEHALIAAYDAGLLLWRIGTAEMKRLRLPGKR